MTSFTSTGVAAALSASLVLSGCALAHTPAETQTEQRALTAEDYYHIKQLSQLALSDNGQLLAFVQAQVSDDRRSRETSIWVHKAGQEHPVRFTSGKSDRAPVFSPDGTTLLFQGSRPGTGPLAGKDVSGLYAMSTSGGEAQLLLHLEQARIQQLAWYPDNTRLLLTLSHAPEVTDPQAKAEKKEQPEADSDFIAYADYKRQGGYKSERVSTLWEYNTQTHRLTRLAAEVEHSIQDAQLSPTGEHIVFTVNRHPDAREGAYARDIILWSEGDTQLLQAGKAYAGQPLWIDSEHLAFVRRENAYAAPSLLSTNIHSGTVQLLAERMDHHPRNLVAAHDALWFIADHCGSRMLFRTALDGSGYQPVTGEGFSLSSLVVSEQGQQWAWLRENEVQPTELVRVSAQGKPSNHLPALYDPNTELLAKLKLTPYQRFTTETPDQQSLDVFFLAPKQTAENTPVILNIKGGPGGMWGHQWFPENQLLAGHGYAVTFVNYRGSTGYGYDYQNKVRFDYGGVDYRDNISALDATLERFPWLDKEQQFITGGSHGGFLTNWATTQTDRFKAAVTQRSVSNWISEAGTQAFPPLSMQQEFGGTLWENYDYYWDRSPLQFANKVTTPTLIIHSSDDHITPIGQGEEWFYALKANQVPVEMVVFRGEGHGLSRSGKPVNLVERLQRMVEWFNRYRHPH
ncbi:S9 family peptidase [Aliidiomarina taiwanensis]|uniref:S9 family peptidase n=1 Tax=Aliidiomarina taiwanensis TaxID=946228 RepID=A0A432X9T1_9GAMM|nr:S9 family peptidase [Aliidiomarina taiwanensis]RUO44070.1 S9 family peptidase [Aliidiomarina taiwanensis]